MDYQTYNIFMNKQCIEIMSVMWTSIALLFIPDSVIDLLFSK